MEGERFRIDGVGEWEIFVPPTVYPPREDTMMLCRVISKLSSKSGAKVLEVGCGSGMFRASKYQRPAMAEPSGPTAQSIPIAPRGECSAINLAGSTPQYEEFTQTSLPLFRSSTSYAESIAFTDPSPEGEAKTEVCLSVVSIIFSFFVVEGRGLWCQN